MMTKEMIPIEMYPQIEGELNAEEYNARESAR